jgi:hypothetical protein
MRTATILGALVCLMAVGASQAQTVVSASGRDAIAAIDSCVPKLDREVDVGYERIAARCPDLARRLERSGWAEWLPAGWKDARNELSAGSLEELRTLVVRELATPVEQGRRPSVANLNEVLAAFHSSTKQHTSLWSRFRAWLRTVVESNSSADRASWIDRMIQHGGRSQTVVELLTYGGLTLVVLLAIVILVNELRVAGLIRARARRLAARRHGSQPGSARSLSWADVERAPLPDKPRFLLELVLTKLTDARRLPPAGAMTVAELARNVKLEEEADRDRLMKLAKAAEQARFSAAGLAPQALETAMEQGRALLERLDGQPA